MFKEEPGNFNTMMYINENDKYKIFNEQTGKREITLRKICSIMGIEVPDKFQNIADRIENNVTMKTKHVTHGSYFITMADEKRLCEFVAEAASKGAAAIFIDKDKYTIRRVRKKINQMNYPCIPIDNILERTGRFFSYICRLNDLKVIGVTGTCGKSTTMRFLRRIVPNKYKTYIHSGNYNSYTSVANHIMKKLTSDTEVYIQETGAARRDSIRKSAAMLNPDAYIMLNVFNHHTSRYGSYEGLLADKVSPDQYMKENGVIIVNFDDEGLANYTFKHRVISFGIDTNRDVDYRAVNIEQNNQYLEFDVLYGKRQTKTHIKLSILGKHNVYNALAAFALSKWIDIDDDLIVDGFKKYSSEGIRQNYRQVNGYNMLIDCYNICEDSLNADLDAIRDFNINSDNKKIAVITGENKLGKKAKKISYNLGKTLNFNGIDVVICRGPENESKQNLDYCGHGRALYKGIKAQGFKNVVYANTSEILEREVKKVISEGDLILFKGIYTLDLEPVIDKIFGTALSFDDRWYTTKGTVYEYDNFVVRKLNVMDAVDIIELKNKEIENAIIPDYINGLPVYRISPRLFEDCTNLKNISLGKTVVNIGEKAFCNCNNLKDITIPSNIKVISRRAFMNCKNLKNVFFENETNQIDADVFKNCHSLENVKVINSEGKIVKTCSLIKES